MKKPIDDLIEEIFPDLPRGEIEIREGETLVEAILRAYEEESHLPALVIDTGSTVH